MAQFKFSLEQVLRYRTQQEDEAKIELGRVESQRVKEKNHIDDIHAALKENENKLQALDLNDQSNLWVVKNFIRWLQDDLTVSQNRLRNWDLAAHAARTELIRRAKERMRLEKFKEKQLHNFILEENLKEQRELDEITSLHYKKPAF